MTPESDEFRRRAIRAILAVVGIAAALGLVVGGLTAAAIYMSGVIPESQPAPPVPESDSDDELPSPSLSPTSTPSPEPTPSPTPTTATTPAQRTTEPKPSPDRTPKPKPRPQTTIELRASTSSAGSFERVTLSGSYLGGNGTVLQVQRREGGSWVDFPTSATVDDGTFRTYVASGTPGPNAFRVVDPATGDTSNVVVFTVS